MCRQSYCVGVSSCCGTSKRVRELYTTVPNHVLSLSVALQPVSYNLTAHNPNYQPSTARNVHRAHSHHQHEGKYEGKTQRPTSCATVTDRSNVHRRTESQLVEERIRLHTIRQPVNARIWWMHSCCCVDDAARRSLDMMWLSG